MVHRHSPEVETVRVLNLEEAQARMKWINELHRRSLAATNPTRQDSLYLRIGDATEALVNSAERSGDEVIEAVSNWLITPWKE